jgi:hypothetical protein
VLADDVVPVDPDGRALPGYPRIKLWGDAVARLGVDADRLERVASSVDKFQLPIRRATSEALPLRWVYVLERHTGDELSLEPAHGALTFSQLHEHTNRNELIHGSGPIAQHLQQCARLVSAARITLVRRPAATMTVEATADAIIADITNSLNTNGLNQASPEECA